MAQVDAQQQVILPPPPPPGGQLPVTPVPACLKPEPAHGDITNFLMALYGQDAGRFLSLVTIDMNNMQTLLAPQDGLTLVANALGVEHGPCAFLAITPSMFPGNPTVEVIHCIRQYSLPVLTPNASADPLQHRTILFSGEMANGQLQEFRRPWQRKHFTKPIRRTNSCWLGQPPTSAVSATWRTSPRLGYQRSLAAIRQKRRWTARTY